MNFFGDESFGAWQDGFNFGEGFGCAATFIGFLVFLIVAALLWQFVFN
jgi:hypothetical protein